MKIKYIAISLLVLISLSSNSMSGENNKMSNEKEVTVFVPPLVAMLVRAEELNGSPLTKEQVQRISSEAPSVKMPETVAKATAKDRGYDDINPNNVWNEWQQIRIELQK